MKPSILLGGLVICALALPLAANEIYTYTGNDFTCCFAGSPYSATDSVSGMFTLATALGDNLSDQAITPLTYSFSDGVQTFTNSSPPGTVTFDVSTDASGDITNWYIFLQNTSGPPYNVTNTVSTGNPGNGVPGIEARDIANVPQGCCGEYQAFVDFDPGSWVMSSGTSPVPEPRDVGFIILGLMAMAAVARSRARRMGSQDA